MNNPKIDLSRPVRVQLGAAAVVRGPNGFLYGWFGDGHGHYSAGCWHDDGSAADDTGVDLIQEPVIVETQWQPLHFTVGLYATQIGVAKIERLSNDEHRVSFSAEMPPFEEAKD